MSDLQGTSELQEKGISSSPLSSPLVSPEDAVSDGHGEGAFSRFVPDTGALPGPHGAVPSRKKKIKTSAILFGVVLVTIAVFLLLMFSVIAVALLGGLGHRMSTVEEATTSIKQTVTKSTQLDPGTRLPRLVLQLTIDQLRSDELQKYRRNYKAKYGWNFLFSHGTFYRHAHYAHSSTFTPVGHSTLVTGGNAFTHGMVANEFREGNEIVYSVSDDRYTEATHSETIAGSSPHRLLSTTTGDELRLFTSASKSFAVSEKDYVAILQAGHLGKGFWWSKTTGNFITSEYHYPAGVPGWVSDWNGLEVARSFLDQEWSLEYTESVYKYPENRQYVHQADHLGTTFPKPLRTTPWDEFFKGLYQTPMSDMITVSFVKELITSENLGKNGVTDFLALSLSANDIIGHTCGPNSLEKEDNLYKLDYLLSSLFEHLALHLEMGLEDLLLVVSSDHGVDLSFEHNQDLRFEWAKQFTLDDVKPVVDQFVNETFKSGSLAQSVVLGFPYSQLYFDYDVLESEGLLTQLDEISRAVANYLPLKFEEIAVAMARPDLLLGNVPDNKIVERVSQTFHPKRSGDVIVVQEQHVWMVERSSSYKVAMHGSPYTYDSHVPILFMGKGIKGNEVIDREVAPRDIAPTIASYYSWRVPTASVGEPLIEVLENIGVNPQN